MTGTTETGTNHVPETHRAAVYDQPGKLSIKVKDIPTPKPGKGEVLIQLYVNRLS
jgi:propanol-preferring alcohol dehydrogenase